MTYGMLNVSSFAEALQDRAISEIEGVHLCEGGNGSGLDDILGMQYSIGAVLDQLSMYDLD